MHWRVVGVTVAAALAAATLFSLAAQARPLTALEKTKIREAVTQNFNDPDSARFRWLTIPGKPSPTLMYCGQVNGKNRFGAYTGYTPFMVGLQFERGALTLVVPVKVASDPYEAEAVSMLCTQKGQNVSEAH